MNLKNLAKITAVAIAIAPLTAQLAMANDNLVVNGDFEVPEVTATQGWDIFESGTTPGLGWTVEWHDGSTSYGGQTRPETAYLELHRGVNGWLPYDGNQHAELDTDWNGHVGSLNNEPASVKIYQDIDTCEGGEYQLQYAWSPRPGHGDNILEVYWNGNLLATHSGSGNSDTDWSLETHYDLPVSGDSTELAFIETGTPDSLGMFLDGVVLKQTKDCPKPFYCPPTDITVINHKVAVVGNSVSAIAGTGGNEANGGSGGEGGNGGDVEHNFNVVSSQINRGGAGGAGGRGGNGGVIVTGNALSTVGLSNVVNTNTTVIDTCACPPYDDPCECIDDIKVKNFDFATLRNGLGASAFTGDNEADANSGGEGGNGGDVEHNDNQLDNCCGGNQTNTGGVGGAGGAGGGGGSIVSGNSLSGVNISNLINNVITRILR